MWHPDILKSITQLTKSQQLKLPGTVVLLWLDFLSMIISNRKKSVASSVLAPQLPRAEYPSSVPGPLFISADLSA
jgi:hypothetical protein